MSSLADLFNVQDLRVLITGGGSGLGLMMAKAFAKNGARGGLACIAVPADVQVTIVGRSESKLASARMEIETLASDIRVNT